MALSAWNLAGIIHLLIVIYICFSIAFTTLYLARSPIHTCLSLFVNIFTSPFHAKQSGSRNALSSTECSSFSFENALSDLSSPSYTHDSHISWNLSQSNASFSIPENLFFSKAFSNSMQPSKIVPFFYRSEGHFDADDITVTTQITSNRLHVFDRLVRHYSGPISVTIHIRNTTHHIQNFLDSLHALYTSTPLMARNVDVHLVIDSFDRQFNTWRNIARFFARTEYVMMLDIDFFLCTDFRGAMRNSKIVMDKLREGWSAFVIPAFEYVDHAEGVDYKKFPVDKKELVSLVEKNRISMFHASWDAGHNSTDYPKFYSAPPGEVYKVTKYQAAYEPYVVFKKEGPPWCDERFVGYGGNKAACLYEMYLAGISYYVLSDHFIIHQNHLYEEKARRNERKFNKKVYSDFKEETCLRYLKQYHELGLLGTARGYNVQEECKKLKGVAEFASEIIRNPGSRSLRL